MLPALDADAAGPAPSRWPGLCHVCRSWTSGGICRPCAQRFAPAARRCLQCGLRLPPVGTVHCGECLRDPPPFQRTVCLADYGFPWSRLIAALKFRDQPELARPLARLLVQAAHAQRMPAPHLLVPVPLGERRLAERGYNQSWALARQLARQFGSGAAAHLLERRFDHPAQAELTRAQRLANLRGAFAATSGATRRLRGRDVALVDDVMTTGATARAAAAALLDAGAARVDLWVLMRTAAD